LLLFWAHSIFALKLLSVLKAVCPCHGYIQLSQCFIRSRVKLVKHQKNIVNELTAKLESSEAGIERKGLILSPLMKFKQICNHPDQYLGQNR
jgi:hypothetical protein